MEKESVFQKLMGFLNKAGTAIMMNLVFLGCSLLLVTMGPAWSALYGAVRFTIRGDSWWDGFKAGIKCHFWRNLIGWSFGVLAGGYAASKIFMGISNMIADPAILSAGVIIPLLISVLIALAAALVIAVMLPLGMYFPQLDVNTWLVTSWDVILHAPLRCLGVAVLMWLPLGLLLFATDLMFGSLIVFVAIYFVLAAFISTILLKKPLLRILKRYPREEE